MVSPSGPADLALERSTAHSGMRPTAAQPPGTVPPALPPHPMLLMPTLSTSAQFPVAWRWEALGNTPPSIPSKTLQKKNIGKHAQKTDKIPPK